MPSKTTVLAADQMSGQTATLDQSQIEPSGGHDTDQFEFDAGSILASSAEAAAAHAESDAVDAAEGATSRIKRAPLTPKAVAELKAKRTARGLKLLTSPIVGRAALTIANYSICGKLISSKLLDQGALIAVTLTQIAALNSDSTKRLASLRADFENDVSAWVRDRKQASEQAKHLLGELTAASPELKKVTDQLIWVPAFDKKAVLAYTPLSKDFLDGFLFWDSAYQTGVKLQWCGNDKAEQSIIDQGSTALYQLSIRARNISKLLVARAPTPRAELSDPKQIPSLQALES